MINFNCTLETAGDGYWSNKAKAVKVTGITVPYINDEHDFGELKVYFNTDTWDVEKHGLIYTDSLFLDELRAKLNEAGLAGDDVDYSEQGMQGEDYVSLDVGEEFLQSFRNIAQEAYDEAYEACNS